MCSVISNSKKRGLLNNVREKLDGLINVGIWIYGDILMYCYEKGRG